MASIQAELGEYAVTAIVALFPPEEEGDVPEVHFEAFQVSQQCVQLWEGGWFVEASGAKEEEVTGILTMRNPADPKDKTPVIVAGKDVGEVETDYFLVPVGIKDHSGPMGTLFPVENRLLPQGNSELKAHLQRNSAVPYVQRLSDFHLLLYLAKQPGFDEPEISAVVGAVARQEPIPEGYALMIDSLAGM